MISRKKKLVKWLVGQKPDRKILALPPLMPERPLEEYVNHESLRAALYPGALWFTHCSLAEDDRFSKDDYERHEFPYLCYLKNGPIPKGTQAIYLGTVRVEEESRRGVPTRVLRHSFIIGGKRYITFDIGKYFYPA